MCLRATTSFRVTEEHGFSMVELMIAMTLSLIVLAGILSIFSGSRSTYETIDRLSRLQENGRFALDQIVADTRSAGYLGCTNKPKYRLTTLNHSADLAWDFSQAVRGFEASGSSWSPTIGSAIDTPAPGSDVLVLRVPDREAIGVPLKSPMSTSSSGFTVTHLAAASLSSGDVVLLSNCEAEVAFQITGFTSGSDVVGDTLTHAVGGDTTTSPGNATASIDYPFPAHSELIPVHTVIYYVRQSGSGTGSSCNSKNSCSLWRRKGVNAPEELVEGIDSMQVLYGVDTDDDGALDDYSTAAAIAVSNRWAGVMSVRVALLARSLDEYSRNTDTSTYALLDTTVGPYNDRRMRKVFSATTSLRNRIS